MWFLKGSSNEVDFREDKSAILMAHGEMSEKDPIFILKHLFYPLFLLNTRKLCRGSIRF